jgi:hypothetical protein
VALVYQIADQDIKHSESEGVAQVRRIIRRNAADINCCGLLVRGEVLDAPGESIVEFHCTSRTWVASDVTVSIH